MRAKSADDFHLEACVTFNVTKAKTSLHGAALWGGGSVSKFPFQGAWLSVVGVVAFRR